MYETLKWEEPSEGVVLLSLHRPERLNAINQQFIDEMHEALARLERERRHRAVVLTGSGRAFCAGADLKDDASKIGEGDAGRAYEGMRGQTKLAGMIERMHRLPQPIIAAVNGAAAGGGFALTLGADIRYASPAANFAIANARIGLSAGECGISWLLPRLVGLSQSFELLLTGRAFDADEARAIGLVSKLVPADELLDAALATAQLIAANSALGVWMSKEVVWANLETSSLNAAIALENRTQVLCAVGGDLSEAIDAFREKRPPRFRQPK
jgi:enoyl-CoA hydratase